MNFGEKLKAIRLSLELTQDELASRLGTTKQAISRYENSEREPNLRTAREFSMKLGVSLTVLADDTLPLIGFPFIETVGARIRAERTARHMELDKLAALSGVDVKTIAKYENDSAEPSSSHLEKLASALGVSLSCLSDGVEPIDLERDPTTGFILLPDDERQLISCYRAINPEGQEKLLDYADDLMQSGKYIKTDTSKLGTPQAQPVK